MIIQLLIIVYLITVWIAFAGITAFHDQYADIRKYDYNGISWTDEYTGYYWRRNIGSLFWPILPLLYGIYKLFWWLVDRNPYQRMQDFWTYLFKELKNPRENV